jgi:hypothetical protein
MRFIVSIFIALSLLILSGCSYKNKQYTIVEEQTKNGVIGEDGYVTVKPIYNKIYNFDGHNSFFDHPNTLNLHWIHNRKSNAYAVVQNIDGKFGVIGINGQLYLKPVYDSITYFFNGFARIEEGGKFGLVNEDFEIVLKPIYDYIQEFVGDIAILHLKNKYGCVNRDMVLKIKPTYDRIFFQQEDFLRTQLDNKWGYLDNKCNILSKAIYDYSYDFSNGIGKVKLDEKVGYINSKGNMIAKPIYTKKSSSF